MASSVSARAIIAAALAAGVPAGAAYADNECGTGRTVICGTGPYTSGITYTGVTNLDLTVNNNSDVTGGVHIKPVTTGSGTIEVTVGNGTGTISAPPSDYLVTGKYTTAIDIDLTGTTYGGNILVNLDGGAIQANGLRTGGVHVGLYDLGATADYEFDMSGGSIDFSGGYSVGAFLDNQGSGSSTIKMSGGTVTGHAGIGVSGQTGLLSNSLQNDASLTVSGGSITMNADNSAAAFSLTAGSGNALVTLSNMTISTTGDALTTGADGSDGTGSAVVAQSDGTGTATVTMLSGSVSTSGNYANALQAITRPASSLASTSTINLKGGTVTTTGASATGVFAYSITSGQAYANIDGGTVTTSGDGSYAVRAQNNNTGDAYINMSGGTVVAKGNDSAGLYSYFLNAQGNAKARIDMTGGSVTTGDASDPTKGTNSHGVYATARGPAGTRVSVSQSGNPLTINTYGANAYGIFSEAIASGGQAYAEFQQGTIATAGAGSYGMASKAVNGDVTANYYQGNLSTLGDNAHGVYATTGGAGNISMLLQNTRAANGQQLSTSGDGAHGGYAYTNGSGGIDLWVPGGTFKTTGAGSYGAAALLDNAGNTSDITAKVSKADITTTGNASHAIYLQNDGKGDVTGTFSGEDVNGSNITTSGQGAHGVYLAASQSGSASFSGDVATLQTSGANSHGIYVTNPDAAGSGAASITYQSGRLTVSGDNSYGLYAEALGTGTASVTTSSNGFANTINVSGTDAFGVSAYSQGNTTSVWLDDATIIAAGNATAAVGFAERAGAGQAATQATVTFGDNLIIDASGSAGKHAFYNADDQAGTNMVLTTTGTVTGSANMGGGASTFTLAGGSWTGDIYGDFDPSETPAANQGADNFIWSGGTLNSGFYGQGGNDTALIAVAESPSFPAAIMDGGEDGGAPESRISSDIDQITFAANNHSLAGRNITNWEQFTVNQNVAINFVDDEMTLDGYDGGNANGLGDFTMQSASVVSGGSGLNQRFTLNGNVLNQGTISMQDGAFGGNFVVGGDYTSKKGRLALDVDFGALQSDVLSLGGKVDGITGIDIDDVGTTGSVGSILVVDMTNSSAVDKNEFTIEDEKNNTTASGIYAYSLEYDLDGDPGNGYAPGLYLTSYANGAIPSKPGQPVTPAARIQPYVPLYEGYQSVLTEMNTLTTMRQRVGKRYWLYDAPMEAPVSIKSAPTEPAPYKRPNAVTPDVQNLWGRIAGSHDHVDPESVTYDYKYDLSRFDMQSGLDGLFVDNEYGRLIGGVTGHYRVGEAKFKSIYGDSKMNVKGWGLGGTLTWLGDNGFYVDSQAEATWYDSELKAEDLQRGIDNTDAFGYALSVEGGKQIGLDNDLIVTPQGQLVWSSTNVDSFTGAYNDDVEFNQGNSLTARLGVSLERENNWYEETGLARHSSIYGLANVYYDFNSKTKATIEQVYVAETDLGSMTGEIGIGATYDWQAINNRNYGVYGEVSASMGFESGSYGYAGNVGFRFKW